MKRFVKLRIVATLGLVIAAGCVSASIVHAQTWDGGGGDNLWSTDPNWDTNVEPVNNGTAAIIFGGNVRLTPDTDVAWDVLSITFNNSAGAFVNGGSQLTIRGGGVTNNSALLQTINNAIVLQTAQSWNAASGNLTFGGNVNNNGNLLTFNGAQTTTLNGILSGTGGVTQSGTGTTVLSGVNTFSGPVTVSAGILRAGVAGGLPDDVPYIINGGTLDLNDFALTMSSLSGTGGTVDLGSAALTVDQAGSTTYSGVITGSGSVVKDGAGNLTLAGANNYTGGTTVTEGTLTGTTTSLQGNITNNATLVFDQSTSGTYAGAISGSGIVNKNGTGTVIWTGTHTYAGPTNVNGGTLQGDTNSLKNTITVASGANVTFNQAIASNTFAGAIGGAGSVTKIGANDVTFSAAQTYTGGTNVNAGSLILGADNILDNDGAVNINGGTLAIGDFDDNVGVVTLTSGSITGGANSALDGNSYAVQSGTISAKLIGTGALTKTTTGTVTLSGVNTYTGGTNVNAGTLALGAANVLADTGDVNVNGGTLAMGGNNDTVDAVLLTNGSITGTGTLTGTSFDVRNGTISANLGGGAGATLMKNTTGTVTLAGTSNSIGPMEINAGRLDVTGITTTPTATVDAGATLGGTGRIGGDVVNNGTVSAGTSGDPLGTLRIIANSSYEANGGSTTNVNITTTDNSRLTVQGNAILDGGDVTVNAAAGTYNAGQKFTFLTHNGTRTGQFDDITDNVAGLDAVLGYSDGKVFFTLLRNGKTYEAVGRTPNQRAVGAYLDTISADATGDLQTVLNGINMISDSQARAAFDQLSGAVHGTLAQVGVQNTTLVIGQVASRLRAMPYAAGNPGGGMTGSYAPDMIDLGANTTRESSSPVTLVSCGPDGCGEEVYGCSDGDSCCQNFCCRKQTWMPWAQGYGLGGAAKTDGNATGFEYSVGGVVGGIERWVDDHQLVGWYGGYVGSNVVNDGDQKINGGQFGAYIFTQHENSYSTWLGGFEMDGYTTRRQLAFDGINRVASSDYDGWQGFAYWENGLAIESCTEVFQPFVALQYVYLRQNGLNEDGADSVDLNVGGTNTNSLRGALGARLQHVLYNHNGRRSLPEIHAIWLHEFLDTNTVMNAQFAGGGPGSFTVAGIDLGRDWAVLGCNFTWEMHDCWSMFVNYDCQTNAIQTFHVGSGGIGHMW